MSWTQVCCQYDGSFSGFLSCVFDCYVNREEPVEFRTPEDPCCSLYPLRTVQTREEHARRVYRSMAVKFGVEMWHGVRSFFWIVLGAGCVWCAAWRL